MDTRHGAPGPWHCGGVHGWTVGQLRAELVGVADDTPVHVLVPTGEHTWVVHPLTGAGYGPGVDPTDPVLAATFPLQAGPAPG